MFLDLSTLECTRLSDPAELFVLDLMDTNNNYTNRDVRVKLLTHTHTNVLSCSFYILMSSACANVYKC